MSYNKDYVKHRERMRNRFIKSNGNGLSDYELIELLLSYAVPRKDVKPIAKELINKFDSFSGVFDASIDELKKINGIGDISSVLLLLVKKLMETYLEESMIDKEVLSSPKAVVNFARVKISGSKDEIFLCVYLNTKNEVIKYDILQEGTIDQVILYPRKVMESALLYKASAIILIHNHPSGYTEPSGDDKNLTNEIIKTAKLFDIRVLDHIVVGKRGYYSFRENNLI